MVVLETQKRANKLDIDVMEQSECLREYQDRKTSTRADGMSCFQMVGAHLLCGMQGCKFWHALLLHVGSPINQSRSEHQVAAYEQ